MNMEWTRYTWYKRYAGYYQDSYQILDAVKSVNASSVYRSSLIYNTTYMPTASGQPMDYYTCSPSFSSPTGLVISGVQRQYSGLSQSTLQSPAHVLRTFASKAIAFVLMLLIHDTHFCLNFYDRIQYNVQALHNYTLVKILPNGVLHS